MSVRLSRALNDALGAQLAARTRVLESGAASLGWKIAASIPGIDEEEGVGRRIFGYLTSHTVQTAGGHVHLGLTVDLCAEVELAVEVGHDLMPNADFDTVAAAVGGVAVALELVDVDTQAATSDIVASNVFHRAVSFGPTKRATLVSASARLEIDGEARFTTTATVDPVRTLQDMVRLLGAVGHRVRAGDRVIGGSLLHQSIEPGHEVSAVIVDLGRTSLRVDAQARPGFE